MGIGKIVTFFGFALFLTSFFVYGNNEAFAQTTNTCGLVLVSGDSIFYNDLQSGSISSEAIAVLSNPGTDAATLSVQGTDWQDASQTSVIDISETRLSFSTGNFASKIPLSLAFQDIGTLQPSVNTDIFWQLQANLLNPSFTGDLTQVMTFRVECESVATIVSDTFTDSDNTDITSHTPGTGTGWTEVLSITSSPTAEIISNEVRGGENINTSGQAYTAQPDPTSGDQDISITIRDFEASSSKGAFIFGKRTDNNNLYGVTFMPDGHSQDQIVLYKRDGGTNTELGSFDIVDGWVADTVIKLVLRDGDQEVFVDGVSKITATDTAHDGDVGTWGLGFGGNNAMGGIGNTHLRTGWHFDDFLAE